MMADQLSPEEVETALRTLAEMWSAGHNADLSMRQAEVTEKVYDLWAAAPDMGDEVVTRVIASIGDPGKWQAQYHDPDMGMWFDIGDAQTDKAGAESREADHRRAMGRGQPQGFDDDEESFA